ncbi:hypothetical protein F66182_8038 [Fusarium sp. NRRL 66182]|nr:hypothetical protein F66182_8038 [Fusarium sp. NRRL 66182]
MRVISKTIKSLDISISAANEREQYEIRQAENRAGPETEDETSVVFASDVSPTDTDAEQLRKGMTGGTDEAKKTANSMGDMAEAIAPIYSTFNKILDNPYLGPNNATLNTVPVVGLKGDHVMYVETKNVGLGVQDVWSVFSRIPDGVNINSMVSMHFFPFHGHLCMSVGKAVWMKKHREQGDPLIKEAINTFLRLYLDEWTQVGDKVLPDEKLLSIVPSVEWTEGGEQKAFHLVTLNSDGAIQVMDGEDLGSQPGFSTIQNVSDTAQNKRVKFQKIAYYNNKFVGYDHSACTWNISPDFNSKTFVVADQYKVEPLSELTATDAGPIDVQKDGFLYKRLVETVNEPGKSEQQDNIKWTKWISQNGVTSIGVASPGVMLGLTTLTLPLRDRYISTQTALYPVVSSPPSSTICPRPLGLNSPKANNVFVEVNHRAQEVDQQLAREIITLNATESGLARDIDKGLQDMVRIDIKRIISLFGDGVGEENPGTRARNLAKGKITARVFLKHTILSLAAAKKESKEGSALATHSLQDFRRRMKGIMGNIKALKKAILLAQTDLEARDQAFKDKVTGQIVTASLTGFATGTLVAASIGAAIAGIPIASIPAALSDAGLLFGGVEKGKKSDGDEDEDQEKSELDSDEDGDGQPAPKPSGETPKHKASKEVKKGRQPFSQRVPKTQEEEEANEPIEISHVSKLGVKPTKNQGLTPKEAEKRCKAAQKTWSAFSTQIRAGKNLLAATTIGKALFNEMSLEELSRLAAVVATAITIMEQTTAAIEHIQKPLSDLAGPASVVSATIDSMHSSLESFAQSLGPFANLPFDRQDAALVSCQWEDVQEACEHWLNTINRQGLVILS